MTNVIYVISIYLIYIIVFSLCDILNYNEKDWPALCREGIMQSPIDFTSDISKYDANTEIEILESNYELIKDSFADFYFAENKFSLKANNIGYVRVKKKLDYIYNLTEIIFHKPSEHTFDGQNADFEMQLVHEKDQKYLEKKTILADAYPLNNKLIISTLFRANAKKNNTFIQDLNFRDQKLLNPINITSFVNNISFFYYSGSLTLPNCEENVDWLVNMNFEFMTPAQLMDIGEFINYIYIDGNNRTTKALTSRKVYISSKTFKGYNQLPPPIQCSLSAISTTTTKINSDRIISYKYLIYLALLLIQL